VDRNARNRYVRTIGLATALAAAAVLRPTTAEAQARGTLQVVAQVVDPKPSYEGLQAARTALVSRTDAVSTLAHISVAYPAEPRSAVVVTIDYSNN
jgi:hypothetical protein